MSKKKPLLTRDDCPGGWNWSSTGHRGPRGGGRRTHPRTYNGHMEHDGVRVERTIGPAKHSKKEWRKIREQAEEAMLEELNKKLKRG